MDMLHTVAYSLAHNITAVSYAFTGIHHSKKKLKFNTTVIQLHKMMNSLWPKVSNQDDGRVQYSSQQKKHNFLQKKTN